MDVPHRPQKWGGVNSVTAVNVENNLANETNPYEIWSRAVVTIISDKQGSGFIVTKDGLVVSNEHVVGDNNWVSVRLYDGRKIPGQVIGVDKVRDLAIIKIGITSTQYLSLGEASAVGSDVVAIGAPEGLEKTITKGIVSAKRNNGSIEYLQTDAAINPGNSGGPLILVNSGKVVGINTMKIVDKGIEGIGFAVSAGELKKAFGQLFQ